MPLYPSQGFSAMVFTVSPHMTSKGLKNSNPSLTELNKENFFQKQFVKLTLDLSWHEQYNLLDFI